MALDVEVSGATSIGKVREINEDRYEFASFSGGTILIVCDGMGGHASGDVASRIACDTILAHAITAHDTDPRERLYRAIESAHSAVRTAAAGDASKRGMGTTCVVAYIENGSVWFGHVGDSRAYLVREGVATQQTVDQTKVQRLVAEGIITSEEAKNHPDAGVLSQAIGQDREIQPYVTPDEQGIPLHALDVLVLCSDGTYNSLAPDVLARIAVDGDSRKAAENLVHTAVDQDGADNATTIVARLFDNHHASPRRRAGDTQPDGGEKPGARTAATRTQITGHLRRDQWQLILITAAAVLIAFAIFRLTRPQPVANCPKIPEPVASGHGAVMPSSAPVPITDKPVEPIHERTEDNEPYYELLALCMQQVPNTQFKHPPAQMLKNKEFKKLVILGYQAWNWKSSNSTGSPSHLDGIYGTNTEQAVRNLHSDDQEMQTVAVRVLNTSAQNEIPSEIIHTLTVRLCNKLLPPPNTNAPSVP